MPLCAGVIVADRLPDHEPPVILILFACFFALSILFARKKFAPDTVFGLMLFLFIASGGYLLQASAKKRLSILPQTEQVLRVRLCGYPERKTNSYAVRVAIQGFGADTSSAAMNGKILLYYLSDTMQYDWQPGDMLGIRVTPLPVRNNGNPCEFNYCRYMEGQGFRYYGFFRDNDIVSSCSAAHHTIREASLIVARKMIESFRLSGLEGEDLALVTALTIGEKDLLDKDLLTSFSRTGAMHIMAVSGLHVGMISLCLNYLLFFLKRKLKILKVIVILILLWAFAFITGLSPSVLRATIMFSFLQAGRLIDRPGNSMNILLASAFILIVFRPAVLFEAGFQLSYLAVASIIAFYEPLYKLVKIKNRVGDYLWQMIAVSLVAQAGTVALTIHLFNIFPLLFLATNIIVIPLSFLVVILAFVVTALSAIHPIALLLGKVLSFLCRLTIGFTSGAASWQHSVVENIGFSTLETMLLTLAVALLLTSLLRVSRLTIRPFLVVFLLFLGSGACKNALESRKKQMIIYNIKGKEVKAFQSGRTLHLFPVDGDIPAEIKKHAATRGLTIDSKQDM